MVISVFGKAENNVGKGENAGCQHFLHFPTIFSKAFFRRVVITRDCSANGLNGRICHGKSRKLNSFNGVLRRFQQYFSHIMVTAYIIHVFPGFHQYWAGALSVLPKETPTKKPRGSCAARTQDP